MIGKSTMYRHVWTHTGWVETVVLETFSQPRWRYCVWLAYEYWSMSTWRLFRLVERPLTARHRRRCARAVVDCSYIPLTNRQDCRAHELQYRERVPLFEVEAIG